ncbi:HD domain-containing protein [Faecalibacterium sp. OF04-11AC]|uniref:HD-GYP domain-containing protein n=1 Tax=Faecalibacterium sp. OF04-11AC TaxID=2293109 RepID=UPI00325B2F85
MEVFDKAMGVIRSPYYRKLDPSIPWDQFEYAMHMDRMTLLAYLRDFKDPEIAEKVLESAEYIHREQAKNQTDDERLQNWRLGYFYAAARYHAGRCPAREVVDVLLEVIEKVDPKDYSPTGINNNLTSLSSLFYYEAALPPEEKPQYACRLEKMFSKSVSYLNDLPVNQYPRVASNAVRELVEMQAVAERPYRKNMLVYMLAAHKPTYVHSLMVANLTCFFVRRLLWKKPEAMVGTMGYDTVEAVQQHGEEICTMAYECGVYHDIGKSMVTMYVGNNSRRLLDEEFVCVQWHAAFGYELLCKIGHKGDLALAALYHHTYYDGQGGYPKDQPPCPKNMKPIVDALTVADSLDAATDNIGRCYTAAKPLEKLIEELRAQKGSRYAPAVVELFDDPDFCTEFRRKLYESRQSVYLEVYRETI